MRQFEEDIWITGSNDKQCDKVRKVLDDALVILLKQQQLLLVSERENEHRMTKIDQCEDDLRDAVFDIAMVLGVPIMDEPKHDLQF